MKKIVNGKIVSIGNLDLFEEAAEGAAINRTLPNIIPNEGLNVDFEFIENIISIYKRFYSILPFPLYSIDSGIKYCSAGLLIKKETRLKNKMWVDNGLFICLDEYRKLCLGFVNESWGVVKVDEIKDDNVSINTYRGYIGFDEFVWVLANIFKGNGTTDYYKQFMPQFVEACKNQPVVMKWELGSILQFAPVPERMMFPENKIVDLQRNDTYYLDIYVAGTRLSKKTTQVWGINEDIEVSNKKINIYGYELYVKPGVSVDESHKIGDDKLKATELYGLNSLFCTLCSIKMNEESETFSDYKGFIVNNNLVYLVDNRLFIAKSKNYVDPKEVAKGVELYAFNNDYIYIEKVKPLTDGIRKETIYSYSLKDNNLRICKIQFSRI